MWNPMEARAAEEEDDGGLREECGVAGVYGDPEAGRLCYLALHALQHRGQEGAGIVSADNGALKAVTGLEMGRLYYSSSLECIINRKITASVAVGESDEYGDFSVDVPSPFHPKERMNRCSVRLLNSSEGSCNTPSTTAPYKLAFKSNSNGVRTYTAGSLSYRPQQIPRFCYKESVQEA